MKVNTISTGLVLAICIYAVAAYPYAQEESEDMDSNQPLFNSRLLEELLSYKRGSNPKLEAAITATLRDLSKNSNDLFLKTLISGLASGDAKKVIDKANPADVKAASIALSNYLPKP